MNPLLPKWMRFGIVGLFCTLLNAGFMVVLTSVLGLHYLLSFTILFIVVNFLGFILHKKHTYRNTSKNFFVQLIKFYQVTFVAFLISLAMMFIFVDLVGYSYVISYILMAALVTLFNFIAHDLWSFRTDDGIEGYRPSR